MRSFTRESTYLAPAEILAYGVKHDRRDLIEQAVHYLEDRPLKEVVDQLPQHLVIPWVSAGIQSSSMMRETHPDPIRSNTTMRGRL